jgi:hypothetical protein
MPQRGSLAPMVRHTSLDGFDDLIHCFPRQKSTIAMPGSFRLVVQLFHRRDLRSGC